MALSLRTVRGRERELDGQRLHVASFDVESFDGVGAAAAREARENTGRRAANWLDEQRHRLSKHVSPETLTMIGLGEHYEQPAEFQTLYELRWRGETN